VEISADVREAVVHQRRVRDDALYKYTVHFTSFILLHIFSYTHTVFELSRIGRRVGTSPVYLHHTA